MNKNEYLTPIAIVLLTALFTVICLAVFLSKGKSAYWISKKMKIGALLLTLTAISTQQSCSKESCYDMVMPSFEIEDTDVNGIVNIDLNVDNKISGLILDRTGTDFSFNILDTIYIDHVQRGTISALDGSFDENTEDFVIEVDTSLKSGRYYLNLYLTDISNQNHINDRFTLNIINED